MNSRVDRAHRGRRAHRRLYLLTTMGWLVFVLAACSATGPTTPSSAIGGTDAPDVGSSIRPSGATGLTATRPGPMRVIVTTGIVADLVRSVVADQPAGAVVVEQVIPNTEDPATFAPAVDTAERTVDGADLVVRVGLGYESALDTRLLAAARDGVRTLALAERLGPKPIATDPTIRDPHVWLDPDRLTRGATVVADELARDPRVNEPALRRAAATFTTAMQRADERVQAALATVPDDRRTIVTDNPGLAYFTERYGFIADVVPAQSDAATGRLAAGRLETGRMEIANALRRSNQSVVYLGHPSTDSERNDLGSALTAALGRDVEIQPLITDRLAPPTAGPTTVAELLDFTAATIS